MAIACLPPLLHHCWDRTDKERSNWSPLCESSCHVEQVEREDDCHLRNPTWQSKLEFSFSFDKISAWIPEIVYYVMHSNHMQLPPIIFLVTCTHAVIYLTGRGVDQGFEYTVMSVMYFYICLLWHALLFSVPVIVFHGFKFLVVTTCRVHCSWNRKIGISIVSIIAVFCSVAIYEPPSQHWS